jgi:hypothetical protein
MTNDLNFVDYMRNLAEQSTLINHSSGNKRFYRVSGIRSLEEVLTNLLHAQVPAIGVDDGFEGRLLNNRGDSTIDRQYYMFYVFGRIALHDHDQIEQEKRQIKDIAVSFISKIIADHNSDFSLQTNYGLRHLDISSFSYRTIAPLPDGLIALAVSFVTDNTLNTKPNPAHWAAE